jgi:segregation and condensation protein B
MTDTDIVISQAHVLPDGQIPIPGLPVDQRTSTPELAAFIECILLVAPEPPSVTELAIAAEVEVGHIERAIAHLQSQDGRGWVVQRHGDHLHIGTAPRFAEQIRRYLGLDREAKLSAAALESLAIIAYQQPITKGELEAIRGVDCSGVLSTLHHRGLIEAIGRRNVVGSPNEYGTTAQFLRHFGLTSLGDLPDLGQVEGDDVAIRLEQMASTDRTAD